MAAIPGRDAAGTQREHGPATPGRAVTRAAQPQAARSVLFVLLVLTLHSRVVDAVSWRRAAAEAIFVAAAAGLTAAAAEVSSPIRGYLNRK